MTDPVDKDPPPHPLDVVVSSRDLFPLDPEEARLMALMRCTAQEGGVYCGREPTWTRPDGPRCLEHLEDGGSA